MNCRSNLMSALCVIALRGWTYALILTNFVLKFSILVKNELEKTVIMSNDEDLGLISSKKNWTALFEYMYVSTCLIKSKFYWYYSVHRNNIDF